MLEHKLVNRTLHIIIKGELDHATAPFVRERLDRLLMNAGYERVILDFSKLTFMDSTGVGLVMGRYKILKNCNKMLLVQSPTPAIDKVFKVSGLYTIIPKVDAK